MRAGSGKSTSMNRADAISKLRQRADALKGMGATALYLFGSTASDRAGDKSDLDLFIDYDPQSRFNAFDLIGIKLLLEEELRVPVDVTTRDGLHPRLKPSIEKSAVRVF
jgi:predicted nucleotidyltransferase